MGDHSAPSEHDMVPPLGSKVTQLLEGKGGIRNKGNLSYFWWGRIEDEQVEPSAQGVEFSVPTVDIATKTTRKVVQDTVECYEDSRTPPFRMRGGVRPPDKGAITVNHPSVGGV